MTQDADNSQSAETGARMQTLLAAFRQIGMPLLQTLTEASGGQGVEKSGAPSPEQFNALLDSTVLLSRELATR
jgi:hypothetical protein